MVQSHIINCEMIWNCHFGNTLQHREKCHLLVYMYLVALENVLIILVFIIYSVYCTFVAVIPKQHVVI